MITLYKQFLNNNHDTNKALHIFCCVDVNYLPYAGVLFTSINIHNKKEEVIYNIVSDSYNKENINRLEAFSKQTKINLSLYLLDVNPIKDLLQSFKHNWHIATFYRIFTIEYFQDKLDKLLYLDADIICTNNIGELINMDISHCCIAGVMDEESTRKNSASANNVQEFLFKYFNAGVVLINCKNWVKFNVHNKIIHYFQTHSYSIVPDQDAVNFATIGHKIFLPKKFNVLTYFNSHYKLEPVPEDTVFIHYTGIKPWYIFYAQQDMSYYRNIYEHSLWADIPYKQASTLKHLKFYYKHLVLQKKYLKAVLVWCKVKYLQALGKKNHNNIN